MYIDRIICGLAQCEHNENFIKFMTAIENFGLQFNKINISSLKEITFLGYLIKKRNTLGKSKKIKSFN